jgi:hypothetical protein
MDSRRLGKLLCALGATLTALAMGAPLAQAEAPALKYRQFAGCPSPKTENQEISTCLRIVFGSGHLRLGKKEIPLGASTPVVGGANEFLENFSFNPIGGLLPVKQVIPLDSGPTGFSSLLSSAKADPRLYAVSEFAGPVDIKSLSNIQVPLKLHLFNSALGNGCYIGSNAHPINLRPTSGTTTPPPPIKPLTGKEPGFHFDFQTEILIGIGGTLVANAFAVPAAEGCALRLGTGASAINVNGLINEMLGLPARAGASEMVEDFGIEVVESPLVYP